LFPANKGRISLHSVPRAELPESAVSEFNASVLPQIRDWFTAKLVRPETEGLLAALIALPVLPVLLVVLADRRVIREVEGRLGERERVKTGTVVQPPTPRPAPVASQPTLQPPGDG
jgi:hypothetical protein